MGVSECIAFAQAQLGKPYEMATAGPNTYDCSGLIWAACKAGGISVGRTTFEQIFDGVEVTRDQLMPGDLIFPDSGHVQLYVGGNTIIEAPHTGAFVREQALSGFWRARRVFDASTNAPSGFISPVVNPLDPLGLLNKFPVLKELEAMAASLTSTVFWKRVGVGVLGAFVILLAIAFVNRKRIEVAGREAAKVAEVAAVA